MTVRRLQLPERTLEWRLKRSSRRSIGLKIDRDGLTVTLPARLPLAEAERAIRQKLGWILQKLAEQSAVLPALSHGAEVLWLGESMTLHAGSARSRLDGDILHLASDDSSGLLAQAFAGFCQRHARTHFAARVNHWSARMALVPQRLALSSARSRWGSCSAAGGVRLNWRLMQAPLAVIDYVVIHELAHLAELNHSPRFGAIVAAHCPDWKVRRDWLKQHGNRLLGW